jgi:hypothetical protein
MSATLSELSDIHEKLIPVLREKLHPVEGATPHDLWDYLHAFGKAADALLYAQLFCPQFIDVDGTVLLYQIPDTEQRYRAAKVAATLSSQEIEESFNFVEVPYLFANGNDASNGEVDLLAEFIAEAWRGRLAYLYSSRKFEVYVVPSAQAYSGGAEVRFFELR